MRLDRRDRCRGIFDALKLEHSQLWGWRLVFDRRPKIRLGHCRYRKKEVGLSTWVVDGTLPWEQVEDTLRHEVAHALAGPAAGHGPTWRVWAIRVGAAPERCASRDVLEHAPTHRWEGVCLDCGQTFRRHKLTTRVRTSGYHPSCRGQENGGSLDWRMTR